MGSRSEKVGSLSVFPVVGLKNWVMVVITVVTIPLLVLWVSGSVLSFYLEFPPRTMYIKHAPFSPLWWGFYALSSCLLISVALCSVKPHLGTSTRPGLLSLSSFTLVMISWSIAWNRWSVFAVLQDHTFLLLWVSYILLLNALLRDIKQRCLLQSPKYLLSFPISAIFWWGFEYLNRFTQNWYYIDVGHHTAASYAILATLSFSTVLPSIWVTKRILEEVLFTERVPGALWKLGAGKARVLVVLSLVILALLPLLPDYLFAALWIVPLTLVLGL